MAVKYIHTLKLLYQVKRGLDGSQIFTDRQPTFLTPAHTTARRLAWYVYEPAMKKLGMGVLWSGLYWSSPGPSRYSDLSLIHI